jgi:membrane protein YqaA with SNARE-associated domain
MGADYTVAHWFVNWRNASAQLKLPQTSSPPGATFRFREASGHCVAKKFFLEHDAHQEGGCMLRGLYDWTLSLAARKSAEWWLAFIAFVESSVFLVPADVLYLPMALSRPDRAYRYALVATIASVLGGVAGWFIGHYAYEAVAKPVLEFYGKYDEFEALRTSSGIGFIILMLITSGAAHLPPIKVVTILSGVIGVNLLLFIVLAIVARGGRFLLLAWLLRRYGEPIRDFIEKRLGLLAGAAAVILILLYFAAKYAL